MAGGQVKEVVVRPFGEGGAELGMTRAEMLEHIDFLSEAFQSSIDGSVQFLFAWLVAMFFVAHRLSIVQFLVANGFYLAISTLQYVTLFTLSRSAEVWSRYAGFYTQTNEVGVQPTILDRTIDAVIGGYSQSLVFWGVVAAGIWWAVSCRRNQPNQIGSPI